MLTSALRYRSVCARALIGSSLAFFVPGMIPVPLLNPLTYPHGGFGDSAISAIGALLLVLVAPLSAIKRWPLVAPRQIAAAGASALVVGVVLQAATAAAVLMSVCYLAGYFHPWVRARLFGTSIRRGTVVWADVRYEDDPSQSKDRPMVVVTTRRRTVGAFYCTTQPRHGAGWVTVTNPSWDPQQRTTYIDVSRLRWFPMSSIRRKGGSARKLLGAELKRFDRRGNVRDEASRDMVEQDARRTPAPAPAPAPVEHASPTVASAVEPELDESSVASPVLAAIDDLILLGAPLAEEFLEFASSVRDVRRDDPSYTTVMSSFTWLVVRGANEASSNGQYGLCSQMLDRLDVVRDLDQPR